MATRLTMAPASVRSTPTAETARDGPSGQDVPQGEDGPQIQIVPAHRRVVDPVVGGAHEDPAEGPEGPAEIGVGEGGQHQINDDGRGRDRGVGQQGHRGDDGQEKAGCGPEGGSGRW